VAIFGENLLDDPRQVEGFRDLFASGRKPYECVGEQRESLLAFLLLLEQPRCAVLRSSWSSVRSSSAAARSSSRTSTATSRDRECRGNPRTSCEVHCAAGGT